MHLLLPHRADHLILEGLQCRAAPSSGMAVALRKAWRCGIGAGLSAGRQGRYTATKPRAYVFVSDGSAVKVTASRAARILGEAAIAAAASPRSEVTCA